MHARGLLVIGAVAVACSPPPTSGDRPRPPQKRSYGTDTTCGIDDFVKPDLDQLTPCGGGKGHCYDRTKTPMSDMLVACSEPGEVCVPDEIVLANGTKLKSCTSTLGEGVTVPGACLTTDLLPEITRQGGEPVLQQDRCSVDQLCVPCTDPTDSNRPTPFCQPIGLHRNACVVGPIADAGPADPSDGGTRACCTKNGKSAGICLAEASLSSALSDRTRRDTCTPGDKCLPATTPAGCESQEGPGVCLDTCFDRMMEPGDASSFERKTCGETEVCVPCGIAGCP